MPVQADDGDIIQDRRARPYVLSSPHLRRRPDHSSVHVITRATDQDEVAAYRLDKRAKDKLGDETLEQANAVLADDDLAANKDRIACHLVLYMLLKSQSETQEKYNALARATDKDEVATVWGQAHEGWTICSEGGVWQKDVGPGGDLATAHGHTRWLGVASVGSLLARIPRLILDRSEHEELARVPPSDQTLGETREELVAFARGTQ